MRWAVVGLAVLLVGCVETTPRDPVDPVGPDYDAPEALGWAWILAPDVPDPVAGAECVEFNDRLWVLGGVRDRGRLGGGVDIFDPAEGTWSTGPTLPSPLQGSRAVVLGDRLHVLGGYTDAAGTQPTDAVYEFSDIGFFLERRSLPDPLAEAGVISMDGAPTLVGGTHDGSSATAGTLVYGGAVQGWISGGITLAEPRAAGVYGVFDREALVAGGGWNAATTATGATRVQDFDGRVVVDWPDVPTPRLNAATASWDHRLFMIGGTDKAGAVAKQVEFLDTDTESWWRTVPLQRPVSNACAAVLSDGIHVVGGYDDLGQPTDHHFVLKHLLGPDPE